MKFNVIILFSMLFANSISGQDDFTISRLDDSKLIKALNNSNLIGENKVNSLRVRVYEIDNGSGSAGISEGHEVSHNLLIAVSEYDENPR